MRRYTGGHARTTIEQNLVLRWIRPETRSTRSIPSSRRSIFTPPAPRRSTDVVSCPGTDSCKLGITSSMGLNEAVREKLDRDGDHGSADEADPHQDERLPERLRPASHRQHRLLRRVDQGRRAHDPRLHPAHRRQLRGRRGRLRPAAQAPAARQAGPGRGRALGPALRGRAQRRRGVQRLRRAGRDQALRGGGQRPDVADRVLARDDESVHRLAAQTTPTRSSAARASAPYTRSSVRWAPDNAWRRGY